MTEVEYKKKSGTTLDEQYMVHHPQVLSDFEEEMPRIWGRNWKANTTIGKLRTVLLHRPGKEFLSVGKPTPWAPHDSSLAAWRMSYKPTDLTELTRDFETLKKAYRDEGVEVIERKPDPYNPPYQVKAIYTDDVCHPAVYGQVILRMYDNIRKGEELPTYQTLAEAGCPVVGMITGRGMAEGETSAGSTRSTSSPRSTTRELTRQSLRSGVRMTGATNSSRELSKRRTPR